MTNITLWSLRDSDPRHLRCKRSALPTELSDQVSSITFLSGKRDSNPRPSPWQGDAPPIELFPQRNKITSQFYPLLCIISINLRSHVNFEEILRSAEGQTRTDIPGFSDQCRDHLGYFGLEVSLL